MVTEGAGPRAAALVAPGLSKWASSPHAVWFRPTRERCGGWLSA
jgi:hypothetical protein